MHFIGNGRIFLPSNIGNLLGSNSESDEASGSAGNDISTGKRNDSGDSGDVTVAAILRLEKFKPLCYMQDQ